MSDEPRNPALPQAPLKSFSFLEAMNIVERGFDAWKDKPHNAKWYRRIDGTPIPNDLKVNIAEAFCHYMRDWHPSDLEITEADIMARAETAVWFKEHPHVSEATTDAIRAKGWSVAVHNDYRLNGEFHTFWLFTKDGRAIKGEGKSDADALAQIAQAIGGLGAARPFHGAECSSYPNCNGGCGLGCTKEMVEARANDLLACTVSFSGTEITIQCNDHDVKDRLMNFLTGDGGKPPSEESELQEMRDTGAVEAFQEADFAILYREVEDCGTTSKQEIFNVPQVWCREIAAALRAAGAKPPSEETADPLLPCDVALPNNLFIRKGCKLSTLLHALERRGLKVSAAGASSEPSQAIKDAQEHLKQGIGVLQARSIPVPMELHRAAHALSYALNGDGASVGNGS